MTATEAAHLLGVSRKTYYKWEQRGLAAILEGLQEQTGGRPEIPWQQRRVAEVEKQMAQLQMENFTAYPAFNGNVAVVDTKPFWIPVSQSPADQGYHWNRNAKSYYRVGESMAQEMRLLVPGGGGADITPPNPNPISAVAISSNGRLKVC